jgi:transcription antitermination protein NusB
VVAGARRRARAYALQILYALDVNDRANPVGAADTYAQEFDLDIDGEAAEFATMLVRETSARVAELDDIIQNASKNWRLDRMSRVDRNILRLATYELRHCDNVPVKVIINEAVELAKRFGTGESAAFVNGVLDRIAQQRE